MGNIIRGVDIRVGDVILYKNALYLIKNTYVTQPGKGGSFMQTEMSRLSDNVKLEVKFRSSDKVEKAYLEEKAAQFSRIDGSDCVFITLDEYEEVYVNYDQFLPLTKFLKENDQMILTTYKEQVISIELKSDIVMKVIEADPAIKGQTAASSFKSAMIENGVSVQVPTYIEPGNYIVVDPKTAEFIRRADKKLNN